MDLSFVILTWNSVAYLEKRLVRIREALHDVQISYEVLVLDNGSSDGTAELLADLARQETLRVRPFYEASNTGTTRSRNRLFASAQGAYICVMDSDVELAPGVLDQLLPMLRMDSGLGIVVPRIHYPSGAWQKSFDRFPTLLQKLNRYFRLRTLEQRQGAQVGHAEAPFPVDYAISAFWLMRRDLLTTVGMLDDRIFYAPEDADYCLRVWKAGLRILYVPGVCVVHHTQEISRGPTLNRAKLSHVKGLIYYFSKHRYLLRRPQFSVQSVDAVGAQKVGHEEPDCRSIGAPVGDAEHRSG